MKRTKVLVIILMLMVVIVGCKAEKEEIGKVEISKVDDLIHKTNTDDLALEIKDEEKVKGDKELEETVEIELEVQNEGEQLKTDNQEQLGKEDKVKEKSEKEENSTEVKDNSGAPKETKTKEEKKDKQDSEEKEVIVVVTPPTVKEEPLKIDSEKAKEKESKLVGATVKKKDGKTIVEKTEIVDGVEQKIEYSYEGDRNVEVVENKETGKIEIIDRDFHISKSNYINELYNKYESNSTLLVGMWKYYKDNTFLKDIKSRNLTVDEINHMDSKHPYDIRVIYNNSGEYMTSIRKSQFTSTSQVIKEILKGIFGVEYEKIYKSIENNLDKKDYNVVEEVKGTQVTIHIYEEIVIIEYNM